MRLDRNRRIAIGRLGRFSFTAGTYVYVGSGWGPGGLSARIGRHLRKEKNHRWHIDYFRQYAEISGIWSEGCRPDGEHLWADIFGKLPGAVVPVKKFGSSDCRCPAHLLYLPAAPCIRAFRRALVQRQPQEWKVHFWPAIDERTARAALC